MWAIGRYDLRLTEDDFQRVSVRRFAALYDRFLSQKQHSDFMVGLLCSVTANFSMGKVPGSEPLQPDDFVPWLPEPEVELTTGDEIKAFIDAQLKPKQVKR